MKDMPKAAKMTNPRRRMKRLLGLHGKRKSKYREMNMNLTIKTGGNDR